MIAVCAYIFMVLGLLLQLMMLINLPALFFLINIVLVLVWCFASDINETI
ncbi:Flp pilus assembly protein TadB [Rahnella inusitata]|nr:Flp pilus assembly protein TadB [Rahnella inusitata]